MISERLTGNLMCYFSLTTTPCDIYLLHNDVQVRTVLTWSSPAQTLFFGFYVYQGRMCSLDCDGSFLCFLLRLIRFWSIEERAPQAIASLSNGLCCAFSADGSVLAAGWDTNACTAKCRPVRWVRTSSPCLIPCCSVLKFSIGVFRQRGVCSSLCVFV